jgi:hypothetical protein
MTPHSWAARTPQTLDDPDAILAPIPRNPTTWPTRGVLAVIAGELLLDPRQARYTCTGQKGTASQRLTADLGLTAEHLPRRPYPSAAGATRSRHTRPTVRRRTTAYRRAGVAIAPVLAVPAPDAAPGEPQRTRSHG